MVRLVELELQKVGRRDFSKAAISSLIIFLSFSDCSRISCQVDFGILLVEGCFLKEAVVSLGLFVFVPNNLTCCKPGRIVMLCANINLFLLHAA